MGIGVNILVFVENKNGIYSKKEIKKIILQINKEINAVMNRLFNVCFVEQIDGIKGNGINCGCSSFEHSQWILNKRTLHSLCYLVKGVDDGRSAWYYVLVDAEKLDAFLKALDSNSIKLDMHGHILDS